MGIAEAAFLVASAFLFGIALILRLDRDKKLEHWEAAVAGLTLGFTVFGYAVLVFALRFGLRAGMILGYLVVCAAAFLCRKELVAFFAALRKIRVRLGRHHLALFLMLAMYWGILWQVMIWDANGFPLSVLKGWGDGAYHLDIIARLATADPFRLEQPIAAGQPLTYPLMMDFLSALFKKIGLSDVLSWHLPAFILGTSLFWLVYAFGKRMLGARSLAAGLVLVTFFGAGIGFWWFFQDASSFWQQQGVSAVWETLKSPPHEYTHLDSRTGGKPQGFDAPHNIVWIVPAVSFFSHQRSFILGAGLSLLVLFGIVLYRKDHITLPLWLGLIGFLPFAHTHSFFSVSLMAAVFAIGALWKVTFERWKILLSWGAGGVLAILIALPQVLFLAQAGFLGEQAGAGFFRPWFGWMMCTHSASWLFCDPGVPSTDGNPFFFWIKNFGFVFAGWLLMLLFVGFAKKRMELAQFVFPSIVAFTVPNILLLQPWEFDNNKALFYWWFLASLLILALLKETFGRRRIWPFVLGIFLIGAGLSGTIDVAAKIKNGIITTRYPETTKSHFGYYGAEEREIAAWIRRNTEPNDAFLTVDWANQSLPMLTGRPIYLGFPGWLWTQGRGALVASRQKKIKDFVLSGDASALCEDGIRYWMAEPAFYINYPTPRQDLETTVGALRFAHPSGRKIIQLTCQN